MGFMDSLLSSPLVSKAGETIAKGVKKRSDQTEKALLSLIQKAPRGVSDSELRAWLQKEEPTSDGTLGLESELGKILSAASHGTVIREVAQATGVGILKTLADKLESK